MYRLLANICCLLFLCNFTNCVTFDEFVSAREEDVKRIAKRAEELYLIRCKTEITNCPKCVYHGYHILFKIKYKLY